jgi:cytochrome c
MRNVVAAGMAFGLLSPAGPAVADADLFKKMNCMACHAVDQKRFGPSLKEVAAR